MATPTKLALIVSKIPLEPVEYSKYSLSPGTRRYLTPVRFHPSPLKPRKLPKIVTTSKLKTHSKNISDILTTFSASKEVVKLQYLLQSKIRIGIVPNKHYGYIKNSTRKRMQETLRVRSKQDSPIPVGFKHLEEVNMESGAQSPRMVDATFNTDI